MVLAVTAMIGVRTRPLSASSARIMCVAVRPSMTGICTSIRMRSHVATRQASRASAPFSTITVLNPICSSRVCSTRRLTPLSSAASTRKAATGRKVGRGGGGSPVTAVASPR